MIESRFPDDSLDRFWFTLGASIGEVSNVTTSTIDMEYTQLEYLPMKVMQSNIVATTRAGLLYNLTLPGSHRYFFSIFIVELDPRVKSGDRVFDVQFNGRLVISNIDISNSSNGKPYVLDQYYATKPLGPYVDYLAITFTPAASSTYLPSLAALEVMQLFDNPMVSPSSSNDGNCIYNFPHYHLIMA
jgi:hypothetical protein